MTNELILLNALEISETFEYTWYLRRADIFFISQSVKSFQSRKVSKVCKTFKRKIIATFLLACWEI